MSIPLDRLYHYIESVASEIHKSDTIIYRFYPHGSKKIEDLNLLRFPFSGDSINFSEDTIFKFLTSPSIICHDQEPLNFNFYTDEDFCREFKNYWHGRDNRINSNAYMQLITEMHLRSKITTPLTPYEYVLLLHSEKNSLELEKYQDRRFLGVYYWSHAIIAQDWFRYAKHDPILTTLNFNHVSKDFLIYNRAWSGTREYRLKFTEMLADASLIDNCNVSFSAIDNHKHYTNHTFINSTFKVSRTDLENIYIPNNSTSCYSADYSSQDYVNSAIEIVLETLFDDTRHHLTEKTLRPIACGRPFILVSTPGSLQYLRDYGFRTFGEYIDESYDTITDPIVRLNAIIKEMSRLANISNKKQLWSNLHNIAQYNRDLFFSNEWQQSIVGELRCNLQTAFNKLSKNKQGYYRNKVFTDLRHDKNLERIFAFETPEILNKLRNWQRQL